MSEANGFLAIKVSDDLLDQLVEDEDNVGWPVIEALHAAAGIDADGNSMFVSEQEGFALAGPPEQYPDGYAVLDVFGDEWMYLAQALVEGGSDIELYGCLHHEHGSIGYYALDGSSRLAAEIDTEGAYDEEAHVALVQQWQALIPADLRLSKPALFADEDHAVRDNEDDDAAEDD
ncbi:hypothetical protein IGB42_01855 [Andreprevotia sp. IGB-42]|uniref:hypothetical protein n=1 Tax=Andreprevotia sp. IGB-42 TaxID=2497473 RepID=UPI0013597DB7|nr:hypothetical protein [Andreprevotia sp. IGB-42]KAF0813504.1 hypothetical protein IGB42_01855 [Andreprevotia sp. IGB-42]